MYTLPSVVAIIVCLPFKTTVELIKSSNNLKDDVIYPYQQLIMPKVVDKVMLNPLN